MLAGSGRGRGCGWAPVVVALSLAAVLITGPVALARGGREGSSAAPARAALQSQVVKLLREVGRDVGRMPRFVVKEARTRDRAEVSTAIRAARHRNYCAVREAVASIDHAGPGRRPLAMVDRLLKRARVKPACPVRVRRVVAQIHRSRPSAPGAFPGSGAGSGPAEFEQGAIPPPVIGPGRPPFTLRGRPVTVPAGGGPSGRTAFARSALVTDPLALWSKTDLGSPQQGDEYNYRGAIPLEPSTAAAGQVVLVTGNHFLAVSTDYGASFRYLHAFAGGNTSTGERWGGIFSDHPDSLGEQDQVVQYDPQRHQFIWLLQTYAANFPDTKSSKDDRERIAWIDYDTLLQTGGMTGWDWMDITPQKLGFPDAWFDFPDMAVNDRYLYVTFDVYHPDSNGSRGAAWVRIPLDALRDIGSFAYGFAYGIELYPSVLYKPVQGVRGGDGYVVHAVNNTQLEVVRWRSNRVEADPASPPIDNWYTPEDPKTCSAITPDGIDFLRLPAPRCSSDNPGAGGAAMDGAGRIWLAYLAGRRYDTGPFSRGPDVAKQPYIVVDTLTDVNGTPKARNGGVIYNDDYAFAFPRLTSGPTGDIAITYMFGGGCSGNPDTHQVSSCTAGARYPSWGVGFLTGKQSFHEVATGTGSCDRMGDFLGLTPLGGHPGYYAAAGYVVQNTAGWHAPGKQDCYDFKHPETHTIYAQNQHPWYAVFGRRNDVTPRFVSRLTVFCSPAVHPGDRFVVSGRLNPPPNAAGKPVTLTYTTPTGATISYTIETSQGGVFSFSYPTSAGDSGTFTVRASWPGDFEDAGSTSPACSTSVQAPVLGPIAGSLTLNCFDAVGSAGMYGTITPARAAQVELFGTSSAGSFRTTASTDSVTGAFKAFAPTDYNKVTWTITAHVPGSAPFGELNASCRYQGGAQPTPR